MGMSGRAWLTVGILSCLCAIAHRLLSSCPEVEEGPRAAVVSVVSSPPPQLPPPVVGGVPPAAEVTPPPPLQPSSTVLVDNGPLPESYWKVPFNVTVQSAYSWIGQDYRKLKAGPEKCYNSTDGPGGVGSVCGWTNHEAELRRWKGRNETAGWCLANMHRAWTGWPIDDCYKPGKDGHHCPIGSYLKEWTARCSHVDASRDDLEQKLDFLRNKRLVFFGDSQLREAAGVLAYMMRSPVVLSKEQANMWNLGKVVAPLPSLNSTLYFKFTMNSEHGYKWLEEYNFEPADVVVLSFGLHEIHLKEGSMEDPALVHQRNLIGVSKIREALKTHRFPLLSKAKALIWMDATLECRSWRTMKYLQASGKKATKRYKSEAQAKKKLNIMYGVHLAVCARAEAKLADVSKLARRLPMDHWLQFHHGCSQACTADGMHDWPCSFYWGASRASRKRTLDKQGKSDSNVDDQCFKPFAFHRLLNLLTAIKIVQDGNGGDRLAGMSDGQPT
eukprot:Hpha_TRINITY_DN25958_c0_g1::TRINITY_DN25958_c0_g1_i1::g.185351::m.185351